MLRRTMHLLAVCAAMCVHPLCAQDWQAGILLTPFPDSTGKRHGQAGDSIRYRDANSRGGGFDIELGGGMFRAVWDVRLTPTTESFAPFYVYHLLASADLSTSEPGERSRRQLALAVVAQRLFPKHPYREHFAAFACRAQKDVTTNEEWGKLGYSSAVACIDAYLRDFPLGTDRDAMEWLRAELLHSAYEWEGDVGMVLDEAAAFSAFLLAHPRSRVRTDIEFTIAERYAIASEILRLAPPDSSLTKLTKSDAPKYQAQADSMYAALALSALPGVASRARIALFNLRSGRRSYISPNAY
jgi:hypothetical protein